MVDKENRTANTAIKSTTPTSLWKHSITHEVPTEYGSTKGEKNTHRSELSPLLVVSRPPLFGLLWHPRIGGCQSTGIDPEYPQHSHSFYRPGTVLSWLFKQIFRRDESLKNIFSLIWSRQNKNEKPEDWSQFTRWKITYFD